MQCRSYSFWRYYSKDSEKNLVTFEKIILDFYLRIPYNIFSKLRKGLNDTDSSPNKLPIVQFVT